MEVKKNVNIDLSKNSLVYFQIGLITMLFASYQALEWKFVDRKITLTQELFIETDYDLESDVPITMVTKLPPPPLPTSVSTPPPVVQDVFDVVEDTADIEEAVISSTESSQDQVITTNEKFVAVSDIGDVEEEEIIENIPFTVIENVPLYPGCEKVKGNNARKLCTSNKIRDFVNKKFNSGLGAQLGLSGVHKVYVSFKIDTKGHVTDILTRGAHPKLEKEAERVLKLIPKMTPGTQRKKPVTVLYSLPIIFEVRS